MSQNGKEKHGTFSMQLCGKQALIEGTMIRLARLDAEGYEFLENPEESLRSLREFGKRIDLFTFIQKLSDRSPKYSYMMQWDNMAALQISSFDHWMSQQIDFKARNKVRKAVKQGIVVREVPFDDALINRIHAIYNESPLRQGKLFWHYGKELDAVRKMSGTFLDRSIFIGAFFEGILIGFAKLVANEDGSQAGLMQIISLITHRDKAPNNALIAEAVRSCAARKIGYLWYANFSYGKKRHDSLADFKRHNGFQRIEVPRYYVALTAAGRIALRLGLHRSPVDRVPEPLAFAYRQVRSFWYGRKFPRFEDA